MSSHPAPFVGVVSDTHGELPRSALAAFAGAVHIIHAGDAEDESGMCALRQLAPVCEVRGNMDRSGRAARRSKTALVEILGVAIYAIHDLLSLDIDPVAAGVQVVIHGHTHIAESVKRGQVLYLNPGSPSRPRRGGPSVARLYLAPPDSWAEIIWLG